MLLKHKLIDIHITLVGTNRVRNTWSNGNTSQKFWIKSYKVKADDRLKPK